MTVKKAILCVGDEHSLSIQKLTLETRGYRVMTCNTAMEAFRIFRLGGVDLVLSNVELPDAPGTELAKLIKALTPALPVILLSAQKFFQGDAPVDLMLKKGSYAPAELLERIRQLLTKRRGPRRSAPHPLAHRAGA